MLKCDEQSKEKISNDLRDLHLPKITASVSRFLDDDVDLCDIILSVLNIPNLDGSIVTPVK